MHPRLSCLCLQRDDFMYARLVLEPGESERYVDSDLVMLCRENPMVSTKQGKQPACRICMLTTKWQAYMVLHICMSVCSCIETSLYRHHTFDMSFRHPFGCKHAFVALGCFPFPVSGLTCNVSVARVQTQRDQKCFQNANGFCGHRKRMTTAL